MKPSRFTPLLLAVVTACAPDRPAPAHAQDVAMDAAQHVAIGRAWTRRVLEGERDAFEPAVFHLRRGADGNPFAQRELARLLNLPLSQSDIRYVPLQASLYAELLEHDEGYDRFVTACFLEGLYAAQESGRGHQLAAYGRITALEATIDDRLRAREEVDLHAMAGNYGIAVAARTRLGRRQRLERSRTHLRALEDNWDALSVQAQGLIYGVPATRVVYSFWLAELELTLADDAAAAKAYRRVISHADAVPTPAADTLATVARARLTQLDALSGRNLLPLWPSGHASCVACHAERGVPSVESLPHPTADLQARGSPP